MAFVASDWKITRSSKEIEYIGDLHAGTAPTYVTGIELHRALMDFADAESDGGSDDQLAIIDSVPSQRGGVDTNITLLNGYVLTSATAEGPEEHIYDTSITYNGGADIYDGIQCFGNSSNIQVIQDGARIVNDFWNQPKMKTAVADSASSTTHRFLVKVRTAGADIDGRRLLGTQRELGTIYTEFFIGGGTNRGNNVLALTANNDLNNQTADATIATWDSIVNDVEGYTPIDVNADTVNEFYYSDWELGTQGKNDFYERAKWIQTRVAGIGVDTPARDADQTIYGLPGDIFRGITHEIDISTPTGTFVEPEALSWGTGATAGTGQLLAIDSTTAGTKMWIQLLSGVAPNANTITGVSTATALAGTVTSRLVSLPFIGASTGSAIIGAFGLGVGADDLGQNDSMTSLDGNPLSPPNNVTFNVTGLDITAGEEDYVLVGPESAGALDLAQMSLAVALNTATETQVNVGTGNIPVDTPAAGQIFVQNDEGRYVLHSYTSYDATNTFFTIPSTAFNGTGQTDSATNPRNVFVAYIAKQAASATESFTTIYNADRNLVVRVRNGFDLTPAKNPIVPFETVATLTSAGGSQAASRVLDS